MLVVVRAPHSLHAGARPRSSETTGNSSPLLIIVLLNIFPTLHAGLKYIHDRRLSIFLQLTQLTPLMGACFLNDPFSCSWRTFAAYSVNVDSDVLAEMILTTAIRCYFKGARLDKIYVPCFLATNITYIEHLKCSMSEF